MMKNESGRSMVEMLGVLAIIGVLSIGGIAGYTIAMNRYRANEILDLAAKVAVLGMTKQSGSAYLNEVTTENDVFGVTGMSAAQDGVVTLTHNSTSNGVKDAIKSVAGTKWENENSINFSK